MVHQSRTSPISDLQERRIPHSGNSIQESVDSEIKHHVAKATKSRLFRHVLPATVVLFTAALARGQSYTVVDLGTLDGLPTASRGINNAGRVVGYAVEPDRTTRAVLFSGTGSGNIDLGTLGGNYGVAIAINDSGQILGDSARADGWGHATLFSGTGAGNIDLGTLGGNFSRARDINNSGQALGFTVNEEGRTISILFSGTGSGNIDLSVRYPNSGFSHINDAGQLLGGSFDPETGVGRITIAGPPGSPNIYPGPNNDTTIYSAYAFNNAGQAAGVTRDLDDAGGDTLPDHAAILGAPGSPNIDLGSLDGEAGRSIAMSINNLSQIVGYSSIPHDISEPFRAIFLYNDGVMRNINDLITEDAGLKDLEFADSGKLINDWGQIATLGKTSNGESRAALLNPVNPFTRTSGGGSARNTKFVGGMAYNKFIATTNPSGAGTTVELLGGTAGSAGEGIYGLNRDVNVTFSLGNPALIASDIVTLTGTEGDTFVLQLTYNEAQAIALYGSEDNLRLGWLDGGLWKLAIDGNTSGLPNFINGAWNASYTLGYYGLDTENNTVWAVLNHNSDFAAIPVPEPSASALLGLGTVALAWRSRFRRNRK
ncbi:MAG TPA: PEP-CTERM sorting domain-containing protein [Chthoniobacterales bacterium]